jgi:uncharacterized SAM-binding protein YcdF (DUF218 family)
MAAMTAKRRHTRSGAPVAGDFKDRGRKPSRVCIGAALAVMICSTAFLLTDWVPSIATLWLLSGASPRPAELLVVLSGASRERTQTAVSLFRKGMAPKVLITGWGPNDDRDYLVSEGVSNESILLAPRNSSSTYEDALNVRQVVVINKIKSVLVVTSPYHCRRTRLIFGRVLSGLRVSLTVTPSVSLHMDQDHWWRTAQGWVTTGPEFPKILWAWITVPTLGAVGSDPPAGLARNP